jgi:alpha-amylase
LAKFCLSLLIHAHQPVGNFEDVLERAYQQAYLPFVQLLRKHAAIRIGLHYSGCLLEWIEQRHPEYFELLRELLERKQIELIGGGFYEPILISIPPQDRRAQIERLAEYLERHFGQKVEGAWVAERVWEPQLPASLAAAGVKYTLVDDMHFLAAGFEPEQLFGYYIAEELGASVKLIPGLKKLRYLIPFRSVEENIAYLRECARERPGGMAAMGDDLEKFGIWPETHTHCYTNGWLERYFAALEEQADWLELAPPGEYLSRNGALGRADLPTASYSEMMEWALPTPVRQRFHAVLQEFASRPEVAAFLRGGTWRGFLMKYAEANMLHKKMLYVSEKIARLAAETRRGLPLRRVVEDATRCLHRAQCNDAYWHGIFGGIYAPHLRTALWRDLIRAEKSVDAAEHGRPQYAELNTLDFDKDGQEELYLTTETCAALFKPGDGATLAALDFRPCDVTLINSMQRRVEPYHSRLREAGRVTAGGAVSIHDQLKMKEPDLEKRLRYDAWPRHAFRLLLFPAYKTFRDYEALTLDACPAFAAGRYEVASATPEKIELRQEAELRTASSFEAGEAGGVRLNVQKTFTLSRLERGIELFGMVTMSHENPEPLRVCAGLELVLNLLAPNEADRYFESEGARYRLSYGGELPAPGLRLADEWQGVEIQIQAPGARAYWVAPIETVSESEEGFERVYQGSQILPVWQMELPAGVTWRASVSLRIGVLVKG